MVEVRASRLAAEVLADEGLACDVTRVDVQVAASPDSPAEVQTTRVAIEVLASETPHCDVSRVDVQVAASPDSPVEVQASRMSIEVLASPDLQAGVTRLDVQVAASPDSPVEVRSSRMSVEALARQGSAGPVVPLALADDAYVFLHNWAQRAELTTSFRNSVTYSPASGAESRRGLSVKPFRTQKLQWMVTPSLSLSDLERLEVTLRRITNGRFQCPIYMDQQELTSAYLSSATTISIPTSRARFFPGARVAIVQVDHCNRALSHTFHTISSMTNSLLTFSSALGVNIAAGSLVFPIMDCEVMLEVEADYTTARVPFITMTVAEAPGVSQLPPLKSDTPTGASSYADRPIWFEEPDWTSGVVKGRSRQGSSEDSGRAAFVSTQGARSRQTHKYALSGTRDDMWNALEFFETRRGRLRSFWHIDQDQYMEAVNVDAAGAFIGVREIGNLTDFQEEFGHVGIVMSDGAVFVREAANIQQILTVFRITMDATITAGYTASDVARIARARLTRFEGDSFTEVWTHTGHMTCGASFIEVLSEQNFSI